MTHSTVKHHLANARSKVGATTTAQLLWILAPRLPEPESGPQRTNLDWLAKRGERTKRPFAPGGRAG